MAQRVNLRQKVFSIDSSLRNSGDPLTSFNISVNMPRSNAFNKCSVLMAEIPKSYYHLDANSVSSFTLNSNSAHTINIPSGLYYTATTFAAAVKTAIDLVDASTYTVAYSTTTGKLTITSDAVVPFVSIVIPSNAYEIAKYLGFAVGSTNTATASVLTSTNMVNMQRYDVLYIHSSLCLNNNDDVLLEIYGNSFSDGNVIAYQSPCVYSNSCSVADSQQNTLRFSLTDRFNKNIELNGIDWRLIISTWNESM